jgi:hypothetical protein
LYLHHSNIRLRQIPVTLYNQHDLHIDDPDTKELARMSRLRVGLCSKFSVSLEMSTVPSYNFRIFLKLLLNH